MQLFLNFFEYFHPDVTREEDALSLGEVLGIRRKHFSLEILGFKGLYRLPEYLEAHPLVEPLCTKVEVCRAQIEVPLERPTDRADEICEGTDEREPDQRADRQHGAARTAAAGADGLPRHLYSPIAAATGRPGRRQSSIHDDQCRG